MVNRNYRAGRDFEYTLVRWFRAAAWFAARTAGSHGTADVIAAKGGLLLLVQAKTSKRKAYISPDELRELIDDAGVAGGKPILAMKSAGVWRLYTVWNGKVVEIDRDKILQGTITRKQEEETRA